MYTIGYSRGEESVTCLPDGRISIRTRWRRGITSPSETRILVIQNLENWLAELLQSFLNSFPQKYLKENPSNLLLYCNVGKTFITDNCTGNFPIVFGRLWTKRNDRIESPLYRRVNWKMNHRVPNCCCRCLSNILLWIAFLICLQNV